MDKGLLLFQMLLLAFSWVGLFFIGSFTIVKKSKKDLFIKPTLWFFSFLLFILLGGGTLIEYLTIGDEGLTNRWALAVLSTENIFLFSLLWFISGCFFTIAAILATSILTPKAACQLNYKFQTWKYHEITIAVNVAFIFAILSVIYENVFTLPKTERTIAMWMKYEQSIEQLNLPYKDIFFTYFTLLLIWMNIQPTRYKNVLKYIHILFVIVFVTFSILQGRRLIIIESLLIWLIFRSWKGEVIRVNKYLFVYCFLIIIVSITFYNIRSMLLLFITKGIFFPVHFVRLSLLQADAGGHVYVTIKAYSEGWKLPLELMPGGSPLLSAFIGLIPQIINPWKSHTITYLFNITYFKGLYTGGGLFMNIVSDGIFNFGRQFFFIQAFLIGTIIGLFDRLRFSTHKFTSTLYISCASISIYAVIGSLNEFLQIIMWRSIVLFLIIILTQIIIHKKFFS